MVSVTDRVLLEPALIIGVLSYLPQQDLLFSQRVCTLWHDIIASSPLLLRKLFLHPGSLHDIVEEVRPNYDYNPMFRDQLRGARPIEYNPLLMKHFPSFLSDGISYLSTRTIDGKYPRLSLGPWEKTKCTRRSALSSGSGVEQQAGPMEGRHSADIVPELDQQHLEVYMRPEASWRRMLPCYPPVVELQVISWKTGSPWTTINGIEFSNTGRAKPMPELRQPWLTFGLMYAIIEGAWFHNAPYRCDEICLDTSLMNDHPAWWEYEDRGYPDTPFYIPYLANDVRHSASPRPIGGSRRIAIMMHGGDLQQDRPYAGDFAIVDSERWAGDLAWDSTMLVRQAWPHGRHTPTS